MKKSRLPGALCTCLFATIFSMPSNAVPVSGQGTWETTLEARDFDGDTNTIEGYYDNSQGITWLADANAGAGSVFDDYVDLTDGRMTWTSATAWANSLTFGGVTNWRLPTVDTSSCGYSRDGYEFNCIDPELGHMFFVTLGNKSQYSPSGDLQPDYGLTNTGYFVNMMADSYWSSTEWGPNPDEVAWRLYFANGGLDDTGKNFPAFAWAVHDGDVGAEVVPLPAAVWLFGSGLLGLIGVARRTYWRKNN